MSLVESWPEIRKVFAQATSCLIASVSPDGFPHMTPIGSLWLREDCTGYYLERFPQALPRYLDQCDRIEVIGLISSPGTWLRALVSGRFGIFPGMRLRGHAGARRPATEEEQERWLRKVRRLRWTRGHALLWRTMSHARDLRFDGFEPVRLGAMTEGLLSQPDRTAGTTVTERR